MSSGPHASDLFSWSYFKLDATLGQISLPIQTLIISDLSPAAEFLDFLHVRRTSRLIKVQRILADRLSNVGRLCFHVEVTEKHSEIDSKSFLFDYPFTGKDDLTKARNLQILNRPTKPKGVSTQMKALDEYFLMVLFVLLLKRVHFLVNQT